jgi:hypothetical protein
MNYIKNKFLFCLGGIVSLAALAAFIYFISPAQQLISGVPIRPVVVLFLLFFLAIFLLATFFLKNIRRGLLIGLFFTSSAILWFFGFRDLLYFGLLLLIVLLIEGFFFKPHDRTHAESTKI